VFVVLDTNHFSELVRDSVPGKTLKERISTNQAQVFTSIITTQEVSEGWCVVIGRHPAGRKQINAYAQFQHSMEMLMKFTILPFDEAAASAFESLQSKRLRIGTMDLKIASICLAYDALLLTRNRVDFDKVPRLKVENWLD
jgi:tRNA(fMet)-specific endonuclease VapC